MGGGGQASTGYLRCNGVVFCRGKCRWLTRDLLIGAVPPEAIADWTYVGVSLLAGFLTFFGYSVIARLTHPVLWFDAAGLAFFAVAGTQKALVYGLNPVMAALMGMLTGIGGGMLRDVLVNEIPTVLRADLYALAALACSAVVAIGQVLHIQPLVTAILGVNPLLRACALWPFSYGWHLPGRAPPTEL